MKVLTIIFIAALLFSVAAEIQIAKVANTSGELTNIDWWPMFHYDLMHRGYSTSTGPTTNQTLWTFATGGAVETSPEVVDGRVYFGSDNGSIYALNASNGALIWNYSTGGPVQSSPAVVDGVVYIGGFHSHAVFALNAESGALLWNTPVDSVYPNEISSTALSNGIVYVTVLSATGGGGRLYALNATTGNFEWSYHPSAWLSSSPAVSDDNVYIRTSTGTVVSLNATSGEIIWLYYHRPDGSNSPSGTLTPIHSSLSIANGLVYVGTARETVQAWMHTTAILFGAAPFLAELISLASQLLMTCFM
jgi:outer membrane protein assembly factor BamB